MPLYRAPAGDVQPALAAAGAGVACRCCPGGISRSTRARRYHSDMTGAGAVALCGPRAAPRRDLGAPGSDRQREFTEDGAEFVAVGDVGGDVVMAAGQVLRERVASGQDPR